MRRFNFPNTVKPSVWSHAGRRYSRASIYGISVASLRRKHSQALQMHPAAPKTQTCEPLHPLSWTPHYERSPLLRAIDGALFPRLPTETVCSRATFGLVSTCSHDPSTPLRKLGATQQAPASVAGRRRTRRRRGEAPAKFRQSPICLVIGLTH